MSVAAAPGAVSTHQHQQQPTAEQIRLAQLIDDKKHDQPEVQEIVRRVLDVVANSTQEEALVALYDCDYDYEKAVALLIEKGHDIASEWRTATNHKVTKKQQQKNTASKNGFGGETDENGPQRGNDGFNNRGKSRNARTKFQQQANGSDLQNNNNNTNNQQQQQQSNDNYVSQQRQRGGSSNRGRNRGNYRSGQRGNDRNNQQYEQQPPPQDFDVDTSSPSDTTQRFTDASYTNRRGMAGATSRQAHQQQQPKQQQWDVGNWNGETLVYSRTSKDEEQSLTSDNNNVSNTLNGSSGGDQLTSNVNNVSELNTQHKSKSEFDPVEAARQIKSVIGIGQSQQTTQQINASPPKPLMDIKPYMTHQQLGQQAKSNAIPSKSTGQNMNAKITPLPPQRIPHQPVIFSDRFDGGMHKIDVQFGNLGESFEDTSSTNVSVPKSTTSASSSVFYQHAEPMSSTTKQNNTLSSMQTSQRPGTTAATMPHHSTEQSAFVSPSARPNTTRPSEQQQQQPVMNQQRVLSLQMQQQQQQQQQQPSMTMKQVVPPQYAAVHHQQQQQINAQNLLLQSLIYQQQQESVQLDTSYDPTAFQLPMDFNATYFLPPTLNQQATQQQQQNQPRYLVTQPHLSHHQQQQQQQSQQQTQQQTGSNRQSSSNNVQTGSLPTSSSSIQSSSTSTTSSTAPKKGPTVPPGMFLPAAAPPTPPAYSTAYSAAYGVPSSVGGQPQTSAATYSNPYDPEHMLTAAFMQLTSAQQAQSPSGVYGSVTPPVQQQSQQQTHSNENKTMGYRNPMNENILLLQQQLQQYPLQQSNSQQQGQQGPAHSAAQLSYYLGHPGSGPSYSPGPPIMFAQPTPTMAQQQQQAAKQQGQHYNQNSSSAGIGGNDDYYGRSSSSSSNKDTQYMYTVPTQPQQIPSQSVGQQQGVNKQQRGGAGGGGSGHVYNNNQHNQSRPFQ